jgi:transcriptional regulator with XRE-family HTH domain
MRIKATKLGAWRRRHSLSQGDVATLTGRSVAGISRLERGERGLSPIQAAAFARALGVSLAEIFELEAV